MKHFLDTSVLRHLIHGSRKYKDYFSENLTPDHLYISKYVQMEVRRGYLSHIIDFYFLLNYPSIDNIGDALSVWSDRFSTREVKAVIQLVSSLFITHKLDFSKINDKKEALIWLGSYIKRIELMIRRNYKDTGINSIRCARANIMLSSTETGSAELDIRTFYEKFKDTQQHSNKCSLKNFISNRYKDEIEAYIKQGEEMSGPTNPENRGFVKLAENLSKIFGDTEKNCKCKDCDKVSDAIIALDMPDTMRLEALDYAFKHLCPPLRKEFHIHPSQIKVVKGS